LRRRNQGIGTTMIGIIMTGDRLSLTQSEMLEKCEVKMREDDKN
jgi:hypothetical protein